MIKSVRLASKTFGTYQNHLIAMDSLPEVHTKLAARSGTR